MIIPEDETHEGETLEHEKLEYKVAEEKNPKDITFWKAWIKSAKNNSKVKRHRKEARAAWDEYEKEDRSEEGTNNREQGPITRSYPIYWASSKTIESAYYARTPKLKGSRLFGLKDVSAMVASLSCERLGEYLIRNSHFDEIMIKGTGDFIHADKASNQVLYDEIRGPAKSERVDLSMMQAEDGSQQFSDPTGAPWMDEVSQDDIGYFGTRVTDGEIEQRIYPAPCIYDEILHTPDAKCESEITEKGYYFSLSRSQAENRFDPEVLAKVSWKKTKTDKNDEDGYNSNTSDIQGEFIEGWECWCKETKKVYFVSPDGYPSGLLDVKDDPYGFCGFFPSTAFIIGSPPSKHMCPTPAYEHLRATIEQLHMAYNRVIDLYDGVRRRYLIDASCPEIMRAFDDLESQQFISVENFGNIIEKGGLENMMFALPVADLVAAIGELVQLDAQFRNNFNEWFGVPDILRGVVDPLVTASADKLASGAAHDRFRYHKALIQKMARDTVEMMIDLALKVFSDEKIASIVGYQYMTPEQQAAFPKALAMSRNDKERIIRIEIETDSTSFVNETQKQQERAAISQAVVNGLREVSAMLKSESPQYAAIALHAVMHSMEGQKGSEDFLEEIKVHTDKLIEEAMQPPPDAPPPPDIELLKVQVSQQKLAMENAVAQRELSGKEFKLQLEVQAQQFEQSIKAAELALQQRMHQFDEIVGAQNIAIEQMKLQQEGYMQQVIARDKMLDDARLERQQILDSMKVMSEKQATSAAPPVNVNMGPVTIGPEPLPIPIPKMKRVQGRAIKQPDGSWVSETIELPHIEEPVL